MPKQFEQELIVEKESIDDLQHVNNVQYLQWVQDIAKAHWESAATKEMLEKYVWVVLNHYIEYKGQAFLDDELTIKTFVEKSSGVTSTRIVEIFKDGALITKATTNWCLLDASTKRPTRITEELIEIFA
ncbi:acyl-CoA thioesterase [Sungkyunkwania multivorans]|uniref:Acyl-CoA thioesterase n=1 Tax=Sungkyunkwania multivorans TaxID=1173618 RepID=A0ABW3CZK1_9FLAO